LNLKEPKVKRNGPWTRDELILALDLYFRLDGHGEYKSNLLVIELSQVLNSLTTSERSETFRNPSGVALKLANFIAIDDTRAGGMTSVSKLDRIVFNEFKSDLPTLKRLASNIKVSIANDFDPALVEDIDEGAIAKEGKRIQKLHFVKERNQVIVKAKKKFVLKQLGRLDCEICGFNFSATYGSIGDDFIECHHIVPLHKLEFESITKLSDLALVCSNCHRMIHKIDGCNVLTIKDILLRHRP